MNKLLNKFQQTINFSIVTLSILLLLGLNILSQIYLRKSMASMQYTIVCFALLYMILVYIIISLSKNIPQYIFLGILVGMIFTCQIVYIYKFPIVPISDFSYMLNGARNILSGNTQAVFKDDYFFWYTTQLGYPILESLLLKVGGGSVTSLQIFNVLFIDGTILLLYFITSKIFKDTSGRLAALLYGSYIGLFLFSGVLSNQHSSLFFILLSIAIFLFSTISYNLKVFISGLVLGVGNILYPIGILFLISFIVYIIFSTNIKAKNKVVSVFLLSLSYYLPMIVCSMFILTMGLSVHGIMHYDSKWKFVLGLNQASNGQYSLKDFQLLKESYLSRNEKLHSYIENNLIITRLYNTNLFKLFFNKSLNMWSAADNSYTYTQLKATKMQWSIILSVVQYLIFYLLSLLTVVTSSILLIKDNKKVKRGIYLLLMPIIGGFLIYLLIEQQVRYRYFFTPLFAILSGGLLYNYEKLKINIIKNQKFKDKQTL